MVAKKTIMHIPNVIVKLKHQSGFSMTEVLVSILLLSVGVVGSLGIQLAATRATQQSAYQTMALQLAVDVADTVGAMVSNESHAFDARPMFDVDFTSTPGATEPIGAACHFAPCATSEFAAFEISEWKARLAAAFPTARLRICRDVNPWDEVERAYKWDCSGGTEDDPFVVKVGWKIKNPDGRYTKDGSGFPPSVVIPASSF